LPHPAANELDAHITIQEYHDLANKGKPGSGQGVGEDGFGPAQDDEPMMSDLDWALVEVDELLSELNRVGAAPPEPDGSARTLIKIDFSKAIRSVKDALGVAKYTNTMPLVFRLQLGKKVYRKQWVERGEPFMAIADGSSGTRATRFRSDGKIRVTVNGMEGANVHVHVMTESGWQYNGLGPINQPPDGRSGVTIAGRNRFTQRARSRRGKNVYRVSINPVPVENIYAGGVIRVYERKRRKVFRRFVPVFSIQRR